MSICEDCAETADLNRKNYEEVEYRAFLYGHPENCGCPCQHEGPTEWAKQFDVDQP